MYRAVARQRLAAVGSAMLLLAFLVAGLAATPLFAQDSRQGQLDNWNATLSRIDAAIRQVHVTDPDLRGFADQVGDVMTDASNLAAKLAPDIAAATAQVKALSPVQGADQTISEDLKNELAAAQATQGDLLGTQQRSIAIVAHGTATLNQINDRRRDIFTARLLDRSQSVLDPILWIDAASEVPGLFAGTGSVIGEWFGSFKSGSDRWAAVVGILILFLVLLALIPGRQLLIRRLRGRNPGQSFSSRSKVVTANLLVAINAFVPAGILFAGHSILTALRLAPERVSIVWYGMASAIVLSLLATAMARALLAPVRPELRLVSVDDARARRIYNFVTAITILQALAIFVDRLSTALSLALPIVVAVNGAVTVASAILIILTVRMVNRRANGSEEEDEEDEPTESPLQRLALIVAGMTAAVAIAACLLGFVALGRFMTTQIAWATMVASLLVLLTMLVDELTTAWFRREGIVGSRLVASIGFAPRSVTQLGVVFNGVLRLVLVGLALLALVAPWGFDSNSVIDSFRRIFVGFTIGSIVISPSAIFTAIAVFVIGLVATRAFQRWLDTRFLPTTRLDAGLRNSIRTIIGHLGWILAAVIAFGYAGLDLSSIAIVAGALSVGIGLGLQGIVNNFVSGLVLLAERPIRAGDWIVVGGEEGIVKRINIRATEIETFDRATVIVPNSSLITGTVKNMVLHDRSGRSMVKVVVGKYNDPALVRRVLLEIAKAHPLVLSFPEPSVQFTDFDSSSLHLQLICFVSDNGKAGSVGSDIRFRCFEDFPKHGISLPMAFQGDVASPPQIGEHSPDPQT